MKKRSNQDVPCTLTLLCFPDSFHLVCQFLVMFSKWKKGLVHLLAHLWLLFRNNFTWKMISTKQRYKFPQLRCLQFNTCTVKPPKQAYRLISFKRGSKGDFKIVMQIYADECISLTCFYYIYIVFPMFRQKVFKSV